MWQIYLILNSVSFWITLLLCQLYSPFLKNVNFGIYVLLTFFNYLNKYRICIELYPNGSKLYSIRFTSWGKIYNQVGLYEFYKYLPPILALLPILLHFWIYFLIRFLSNFELSISNLCEVITINTFSEHICSWKIVKEK